MRYKDLSIRAKLLLMTGITLTFVTTAMVLAFLGTRTIQNRYQAMIDNIDQLKVLIVSISDQIHIVSYQELTHFYTPDPRALLKREEALARIDRLLQEVDGLNQEFIKDDEIKNLKNDVADYRAVFLPLMEKIQVVGDRNSGLHAQLEQSTQNLENILWNLKGAEASKMLNLMRSMVYNHEKMVIKKDQAAAATALEISQQLASLTEQSRALKSAQKTEFKALLVSYDQTLKNFQTLFSEVSTIQSNQLKIMDQMDSRIIGLSDRIRVHNEAEVKELNRMAQWSLWMFMGVFVLIMIISAGSLAEFTHISRSLTSLSSRITKTAKGTKQTSGSLQVASEKVSASTTEQASAIQETVATLNEITAMVNQSVNNASSSSEKANKSFHIATEGKEAVNHMRLSMQEIQSSIQDMTNQVDQSNQRVASFIQIIEKIASKTQVINDIVFQTKLLSFNASVEAARAGEHGRGFAVVAEEVGNLAQMSGSAAKEIGELLSRSRGEVEEIIRDSKTQMVILVNKGGEKVSMGVAIANRCEDILQEVVENVNDVKKLMEEISTAAKEEAEGVSNITIAMNEIDSSTHANSDMAHETMNYAETLSKQSHQLHTIIREFDQLVSGSKGKKLSPAAEPKVEAPPENRPPPQAANVFQLVTQAKNKKTSATTAQPTQSIAVGAEHERQGLAQIDPKDPGFGKD